MCQQLHTKTQNIAPRHKTHAPIVHCVKRRDLVDEHWRHVENFRDLVHGGERQKVADLTLRKVEQRHDGALLEAGRILANDLLDLDLVLWRKLKRRVLVVVVGVCVLRGNARVLCERRSER